MDEDKAVCGICMIIYCCYLYYCCFPIYLYSFGIVTVRRRTIPNETSRVDFIKDRATFTKDPLKTDVIYHLEDYDYYEHNGLEPLYLKDGVVNDLVWKNGTVIVINGKDGHIGNQNTSYETKQGNVDKPDMTNNSTEYYFDEYFANLYDVPGENDLRRQINYDNNQNVEEPDESQ
ncbi:hypothetical protein M8J75_005673 [Diaphorina citri]|nr:hypothetical protein M8J75_005673 [Diaphorina citri]KAI5734682.1 hypothetical protein M8J77_009451 [Diaphorina citri]